MERSLDYLLKDLQGSPRYTLEEQLELGRKKDDGDNKARDLLFLSCAHWAVKLGMKFHRSSVGAGNTALDIDNMVQSALCGLLMAVDKYDYNRGIRLITIATWYIRRNCLTEMGETAVIHIPVGQRLTKEVLPSKRKIMSFSFEIDDQFKEGESKVIANDDWVNERDRIENMELVISRMGQLLPMECFVLKKRLEGLTLKQIGDGLNLTRSRIQQISSKAISNLRDVVKMEDNDGKW